MVSSLLPIKAFTNRNSNVNTPTIAHTHAQQLPDQSAMGKITISRNFSAGGDGQSLLNQNLERKVPDRNVGAPIRSSVNIGNTAENLPPSL